jgi:FkbM family methyltransferase
MFADLIFDFGLHRGEDTEFYLKKGFRVVAFEANPHLVSTCRERFATAIEARKLVIVEGAIVATDESKAGNRSVTFYVNRDKSIWGTTDKVWVERNSSLGHDSDAIEVPIIDLERVILEYGIPYYMKIDIEGCDMICLRMLEKFRTRPRYVSMESNKTSLAETQVEMDTLIQLGYVRFKLIEQSSITKVQRPPLPALEGGYVEHQFDFGSSGLFGAELPGRWHGRQEAMLKYTLVHLGYYLLGDAGIMRQWSFPCAQLLQRITRFVLRLLIRNPVPGWYDTHAQNVKAVSFAAADADRVIAEVSR